MFLNIPTQFFLCSGASEGYTELNAFDGALLDAGIGNTNLLKMSSILPPNCSQVNKLRIPEDIAYGALLPVAYASKVSDIPGAIISACVAVGIAQAGNKPGLIMEYASPGRKDTTEKIARQMVEKGMEKRNEKIKEILSVSAQIEVKRIGCVFAAVALIS